jgi:hypothetical protein
MNLNKSVLIKFPNDQFTDADGKVYFAIQTGGSGNITIYMENQTDPDNKFIILSMAKMEMKIYADPSVNEGGTFTVTAKSGDELITDATVTFVFAGETKTTTTGTVQFTVPSVPDSLDYRIEATAPGYTSATTTIKVVNIPQLGIVLSTTADITTNSQFDVTIADDLGNAIIGATITINGKTYTSGSGGKVTITAPETAGTYEITVTKPGFTAADPVSITVTAGGIPGFELLAVIAAIGVAFILLRRRRH